jgi:preprotein translocase subunit SecF
MFILKYKKIFFSIAVLLMVGSAILIGVRGMKLGVDFTGGSVLGITADNLSQTDIQSALVTIPGSSVQSAGESGYIIKTPEIDQTTKDTLVKQLSEQDTTVVETRFNTIGPSVGSEIRIKTVISIILISLLILLFVAWAFRDVARPVSSWTYGFIVIAVLVHDIIIPAGIFALLGREVNTLFVIGVLTILGVSINDTIVIFDRIRENLTKSSAAKNSPAEFAAVVGKSISETLTRSIMTSVTVLLALAALYVWGPAATHDLALVMFLGMFFGTYSSIFIAAPLLVVYNNYQSKNKK